MRQWKHASDRAILFRYNVVAAVTKCALDDARPSRTMKEAGVWHGGDESIPRWRTGVIERSQSNRHEFVSRRLR
jgi:hypothetical protein